MEAWMKYGFSAVVLLTLSFLFAIAVPVDAHHGWDFCQPKDQISLTGKVVSLKLQNPHSNVQIQVKDRNGVVTIWSFELGPVGQLARTGWAKDALKAGDEISVKGYPCGGGSQNRGAATEVLFAGKKLTSSTHGP
jgi:hypothetical protein